MELMCLFIAIVVVVITIILGLSITVYNPVVRSLQEAIDTSEFSVKYRIYKLGQQNCSPTLVIVEQFNWIILNINKVIYILYDSPVSVPLGFSAAVMLDQLDIGVLKTVALPYTRQSLVTMFKGVKPVIRTADLTNVQMSNTFTVIDAVNQLTSEFLCYDQTAVIPQNTLQLNKVGSLRGVFNSQMKLYRENKIKLTKKGMTIIKKV